MCSDLDLNALFSTFPVNTKKEASSIEISRFAATAFCLACISSLVKGLSLNRDFNSVRVIKSEIINLKLYRHSSAKP